MLAGVRVSAKMQEQMVKRATLPEVNPESPVDELTLDGGMVRVRTPKGQARAWRQYHGLRVNGDGIGMAGYKGPDCSLGLGDNATAGPGHLSFGRRTPGHLVAV